MPAGQPYTGDPLDGDLPGLTGYERWRPLTAAIQRQVTGMTLLPYDPTARQQMLRLVQQRRADADDDETGVVQFCYLPAAVGFDTLFVENELLITAESCERGRAYLDALKLAPQEVACPALRPLVRRLIPEAGTTAGELADTARNLRAQGLSASLANITPTAGIHKHPPPSPVNTRGGLKPRDVSHVVERRARMLAAERPAGGRAAGRPATVAIIDTGITDQRRDDGWLAGIERTEANIDRLHRFPLGDPAAQRDEYLDLDAGHGTFVAGIVQQIAPAAGIRVYRAVDSDGIGSELDVACAMIHAAEDGNQLINLSLACQTQDDVPPIAIQAALNVIRRRQLDLPEHERTVIVAAAGNFGDTRPAWPAAFRDVASVTALTPDMQPAPWSSHGFWTAFATCGQGILSTFVTGTEAPQTGSAPYVFPGPDPWALWTGTSFAAPQVTGTLAWRIQDRDLSPHRALDTLADEGYPIPDYGQALDILPGH